MNIGVKDLAGLRMPNACPRCFWLKAHHGLPWQRFPGIFNEISNYTSRCIQSMGTQGPYGEGEWVKPPHWSKLSVTVGELTLRGGPDDVRRLPAGVKIWDNKTARLTQGQDALMPLYEAQVNGYAWLWPQVFKEPVVEVGLCYWQPMTVENLTRPPKIYMGFEPTLVRVKIDPTMIPDLLARAREILFSGCPTPGKGCKDCSKLADIASDINPTRVTR